MWNDGISKQLDGLLDSMSKEIPEEYIDALKEVIDEEVGSYKQNINGNVPIDTGGLKSSFTVEKIIKQNYYGYRAYFKGDNKNGVPNEKIANILNYGTEKIYGTFFIDRAIRKLKGMGKRIEKKAEKNIAKRIKELQNG